MWLLKLHFAISVLCMLTCLGFRTIGRDIARENGWVSGEKKKLKISAFWIFFIPLLNILATVVILITIFVKKSEYVKWVEENKKSV